LPNLGSVATAYRQEGIALNIVGLNPSTEDQQLFQKFVAGNGTLSHAQLPGEGGQAATGSPFPWTPALVALALVGLLALNELWTAGLTCRPAWGRSVCPGPGRRCLSPASCSPWPPTSCAGRTR